MRLDAQGAVELGGVDGVVLDGVAGAQHLGLVEAGDGVDDLPLHLHGQRGGHAVDVDLVGVEAFGLEEELVLGLVGKLDDLVFDGRAIARADALDLAGIHGRAMDVLADDAERLRRGEGDVAADLRLDDLFGAEAEGRGIGVAGLLFEGVPADGAAVEAGRGAGLEAAGAQAEGAQRFAEEDGGGLAAAAGGIALFAAVDEAVEEGAGGDDGGAGEEVAAVAELEAEDAACGRGRQFAVAADSTHVPQRTWRDPGSGSKPGSILVPHSS